MQNYTNSIAVKSDISTEKANKAKLALLCKYTLILTKCHVIREDDRAKEYFEPFQITA